jgi:hypothetical protein
MSVVRVDLMASAVGKIGGVTWHHLYLVAADFSGKQWYLRTGPQCLPVEQVAGRKSQYGDAIDDYEPSPAGPYGVVAVSSGAYEPGSIDFDPVAANVTVASGDAAGRLWEAVQKAARDLQEEAIPYDPAGRGTNWAIMEILRRCGAKASVPPKRWAPGAAALADGEVEGATRRVGQAVALAA